LVADDLRDTLRRAKQQFHMGRALAAPQIGAPVRLVFVELSKHRMTMVNPEIVDIGPDDFEVWDDCFSFPQLMVRVARAHDVTLRYLDLRGREHRTDLSGDMAELVQHEIDHLDGVLAIDQPVGADPFCLRSEWLKRYEPPGRYGAPFAREHASH
jgi:peptide deformylase